MKELYSIQVWLFFLCFVVGLLFGGFWYKNGTKNTPAVEKVFCNSCLYGGRGLLRRKK